MHKELTDNDGPTSYEVSLYVAVNAMFILDQDSIHAV